jgi:hypothetical protein
MTTSKFEKAIARIVEEGTRPEPVLTKVASIEKRLDNLDGDVAKSLTKIASILRNQSIEPSYQDIIDFIGEG